MHAVVPSRGFPACYIHLVFPTIVITQCKRKCSPKKCHSMDRLKLNWKDGRAYMSKTAIVLDVPGKRRSVRGHSSVT